MKEGRGQKDGPPKGGPSVASGWVTTRRLEGAGVEKVEDERVLITVQSGWGGENTQSRVDGGDGDHCLGGDGGVWGDGWWCGWVTRRAERIGGRIGKRGQATQMTKMTQIGAHTDGQTRTGERDRRGESAVSYIAPIQTRTRVRQNKTLT